MKGLEYKSSLDHEMVPSYMLKNDPLRTAVRQGMPEVQGALLTESESTFRRTVLFREVRRGCKGAREMLGRGK